MDCTSAIICSKFIFIWDKVILIFFLAAHLQLKLRDTIHRDRHRDRRNLTTSCVYKSQSSKIGLLTETDLKQRYLWWKCSNCQCQRIFVIFVTWYRSTESCWKLEKSFSSRYSFIQTNVHTRATRQYTYTYIQYTYIQILRTYHKISHDPLLLSLSSTRARTHTQTMDRISWSLDLIPSVCLLSRIFIRPCEISQMPDHSYHPSHIKVQPRCSSI